MLNKKREIEFRGKLSNGEWKYGSLINFTNTASREGKCRIFSKDQINMYANTDVDPDTVGQYTGLTLKKTKVYDGDIIKCGKEKFVVVWEESGFYIKKITAEYKDGLSPGSWRLWEILAYRSRKVIGNIHDNKELLEEGK
jgi:hypothetical protein